MTATIITMYIFVLLLLLSQHYGKLAYVWLTKPLASFAFVILAIQAGAFYSYIGILFFIGFLFSWLGDVLLIKKQTFIFGLFCFLLTHIAYIIAFYSLGISILYFIIAFLVTLFLGLFIAIWIIPHVEKRLVMPVIIYMLIIALMLSAAIATNNIIIMIAALLFCASDISVARDQFMHAKFFNIVWGLLFYYTAQALLALNLNLI